MYHCVDPKDVKTILSVRRSLGYTPSFKTVIPATKEEALPFVISTNAMAPIHVYSDGSRFKGGISASALLYIKDHLVKTLQVYLSSASKHIVYEVEGIGLLMGLHLLCRLN